ncbi:hypothetical protein EVAR_59299_1 [Eumeta japonica]|uniref:Uncharacterized protein n=1 Tax=Eumeta variegata TaxID=151549 RepID=A0A4C1YDR4_EUMVA|nr:hypothetical protein EVAR_59299_1 [Eumeta japonica]
MQAPHLISAARQCSEVYGARLNMNGESAEPKPSFISHFKDNDDNTLYASAAPVTAGPPLGAQNSPTAATSTVILRRAREQTH